MDQTEQQYIDGLFDRLQDAERQSGPRDPAAERHIQQRIARQPGAPYYMTQALIVQEEALKGAQWRIEELEREIEELRSAPPPQQSSGGFLGGLFGGGSRQQTPEPYQHSGSVPRAGGFSYPGQQGAPGQDGRYGYGQQHPMHNSPLAGYQQQGMQPGGGGGFLAGAMQTAAGVAGGVLLGNMLGDMFGGDDKSGAAQAAEAAKPGEAAAGEAKPAEQAQAEDPFANVEETKYDENDSIFGGMFGGGGDDGGYDI